MKKLSRYLVIGVVICVLPILLFLTKFIPWYFEQNYHLAGQEAVQKFTTSFPGINIIAGSTFYEREHGAWLSPVIEYYHFNCDTKAIELLISQYGLKKIQSSGGKNVDTYMIDNGSKIITLHFDRTDNLASIQIVN